jgi:TonB-dependent receptor
MIHSNAFIGRSRRLAMLSASALCAVIGCATPTFAQTAGDNSATEVGEVVVTGFRGSLAKALNTKRESAVAVDAILAEDIGKFPDLNLSESIQRIPGVALARDGGEGRQIAVRGLGATFTRVRIDGMEALASTGGADSSGGANRSRSFDFNVFASDLFSAIKVAKTAEAAQEEGSLGATVDLQTGRPFDTPGFKFAASAQAAHNQLSGKTGPRLAALISKTFLDDTIGILVSGAYSKRDTIEEGSSTVRWATNVGSFSPGFQSGPASGSPSLTQLNAAFHPRFPRYDHFDNHSERTGFTASLQWKPTDRTLVTLDGLYADFKATRREYYLEAPSFSTGGACTVANRPTNCGVNDFDVVSATINNNILTKGTFNDVDLRTENRFDTLDTKFKQVTLNAEHQFNEKLGASLLLGHSNSFHDNPFQTTLSFDKFNIQGYSYDYTDPRHPGLSYGTTDVTDSSGWVLRELRQRKITAENTYDTAKFALKYQINDALRVSGGLDYKKYDFTTTELRRVDAAGSTANVEVFTTAQISMLNGLQPLSNYTTIAHLNGKGLGIPTGTPTAWLVPDLEKFYQLFNVNDQTSLGGLFKLGTAPALTNNKGVSEEDKGAFVQADFNTAIHDIPVRGNVGVRYVKTAQESSGYAFVGGQTVPIVATRDYTDTLPSLNLVVEPRENFLLRFGAAKVMARAELTQLSPGAAFNVAGSTRAVTAGNPSLDPIRSTNYDVAGEWYFQPGSLLSVALFEKKISTFVQNVTTNQPYANNPFGLPDSAAIAACGNQTTDCNTTSTNWAFTAPVNTPGGKLKGFEVNYQQSFKFLPGLLSHTGVLLNYTSVIAKVNYVNGAGMTVARQNLTNLSPHSYNATLYYEDAKISTRVSAAYRSKYLTAVPGADTTAIAPIAYQGTNETLNIDASLQYTINPHLKLTFEGVNLTDEFQDQFIGDQNLESVYHHTGREFIVGVRYAF